MAISPPLQEAMFKCSFLTPLMNSHFPRGSQSNRCRKYPPIKAAAVTTFDKLSLFVGQTVASAFSFDGLISQFITEEYWMEFLMS